MSSLFLHLLHKPTYMGRYVQQPFAGRCIGSQLCLTPSVHPWSAGDGDTRSALPLFTLLSHRHTECHVCLKEGSSTSFPSKGSYFPCGFEQSAGVSWITESFAFLISLFLPFSLASFSLTPPFWFLSLSSSLHLSVPVHPTCLASFLPCFSLSP